MLRADDTRQDFTLRKAPGLLQKVSTTTSTGLSGIDGIPLSLGLWRNNYQSYNLINELGSKSFTNGNGKVLRAYWSNSDQVFVFTGHEDCSGSGGCTVTSFTGNPTRSLGQLFPLGVTGMGGWVNGVNVNYNFNIANWSLSANSQVAVPLGSIKLVKQTSVTLAPNDTSIPTNLVCVGQCTAVNSNGDFVEESQNTWPPLVKTDVVWDSTLSAPTVSNGVVTKAVNWIDPNNKNNGH